MTVNDQILETIQQLGGIFLSKGITSVPVNLVYLEEKVAPGMEKHVVIQLIIHLEDLFLEYLKKEKKVHKFTRYIESFKTLLDNNSDGESLIGHSKRSA